MKRIHSTVFLMLVLSIGGLLQADFVQELIKAQEARGIRVTTTEEDEFEKQTNNLSSLLIIAPSFNDISDNNIAQISGLLGAFYTLFFDPLFIRFDTKPVMNNFFEQLLGWHDALKNKNVMVPWIAGTMGAELKKLVVQALKELCLVGRYTKHREENLVTFKLRVQNILMSVMMDSYLMQWKDQLINNNENFYLGSFYSWDVAFLRSEFKDSAALTALFNKLDTVVDINAEQEAAQRHEQEVALEKQQTTERKQKEAQLLKDVVLNVQQQSPTDAIGRGSLYLDYIRILLDPAYMELPLADRKVIDNLNDKFRYLHGIIGRTFVPIFSQEYSDQLKLLLAKAFDLIYSPEVGKSGGASFKNHVEFVIKTLMPIDTYQSSVENQIKFQWIKPLYFDNQLLSSDMKKKLFALFGNSNFQRWQATARTLTFKVLPSDASDELLFEPAIKAPPFPVVFAPKSVENPYVAPAAEDEPVAMQLPVFMPAEKMEQTESGMSGDLDQISKNLIAQARVAPVEVVENTLAHVAPDQKFALLKMTDEKENTALHGAAYEGRADVIGVLLKDLTPTERFELLKMQQMYGKTPLHLAASSQNKKITAVAKLLQGLMPQQKVELINIKDKNGKRPVDIAQDFNSQAIVVTLREIENKGGR